MNCHDTHTVPGARRLTREGTDSLATHIPLLGKGVFATLVAVGACLLHQRGDGGAQPQVDTHIDDVAYLLVQHAGR